MLKTEKNEMIAYIKNTVGIYLLAVLMVGYRKWIYLTMMKFSFRVKVFV